jgi:hypothetical protein
MDGAPDRARRRGAPEELELADVLLRDGVQSLIASQILGSNLVRRRLDFWDGRVGGAACYACDAAPQQPTAVRGVLTAPRAPRAGAGIAGVLCHWRQPARGLECVPR